MISRNKYLSQLINNKNNGFPKVITGVRRCGKSYLLTEIYKDYLIKEGVDKKIVFTRPNKGCSPIVDMHNII